MNIILLKRRTREINNETVMQLLLINDAWESFYKDSDRGI
jgi:hypothetical protein